MTDHLTAAKSHLAKTEPSDSYQGRLREVLAEVVAYLESGRDLGLTLDDLVFERQIAELKEKLAAAEAERDSMKAAWVRAESLHGEASSKAAAAESAREEAERKVKIMTDFMFVHGEAVEYVLDAALEDGDLVGEEKDEARETNDAYKAMRRALREPIPSSGAGET